MYIVFLYSKFLFIITYFGKYFMLYSITWIFAMHIKDFKTSFYGKETYFICLMRLFPKSLKIETFFWNICYKFHKAIVQNSSEENHALKLHVLGSSLGLVPKIKSHNVLIFAISLRGFFCDNLKKIFPTLHLSKVANCVTYSCNIMEHRVTT